MDPFGNIPVFMTTLKDVSENRKKGIIVRELLIALLILVVFLFVGEYLLTGLNITEPSLSIAGGIILFLIAIKMIFPPSISPFEEEFDGEPFIVPLAIPYVAGPSAMAAVMVLMNREPDRWMEWLLALVSAWFISGIILFLSNELSRYLGKKGLIALERLMGLILTTIAVEMFMSGIREFMGA